LLLSPAIRNYGDVLCGWSGGKTDVISAEFDKKTIEVAASVGPLEGFGRLLIAQLELEERCFEFIERNEIAGGEKFALDDREVDFDLVEPAGVDRCMDKD